ncbi:hypothetical protein SELMODRAFT_415972 [Selaginella moellendorffii]|uniref:Uncharacterized protein n=1 Tax=Selaginella moellendorffii TaxID=88036 RepID=D8RXP0_SELML|nr:hypothetical protein SELMODRAFT_415972 [Selaginella moellendorffii]
MDHLGWRSSSASLLLLFLLLPLPLLVPLHASLAHSKQQHASPGQRSLAELHLIEKVAALVEAEVKSRTTSDQANSRASLVNRTPRSLLQREVSVDLHRFGDDHVSQDESSGLRLPRKGGGPSHKAHCRRYQSPATLLIVVAVSRADAYSSVILWEVATELVPCRDGMNPMQHLLLCSLLKNSFLYYNSIHHKWHPVATILLLETRPPRERSGTRPMVFVYPRLWNQIRRLLDAGKEKIIEKRTKQMVSERSYKVFWSRAHDFRWKVWSRSRKPRHTGLARARVLSISIASVLEPGFVLLELVPGSSGTCGEEFRGNAAIGGGCNEEGDEQGAKEGIRALGTEQGYVWIHLEATPFAKEEEAEHFLRTYGDAEDFSAPVGAEKGHLSTFNQTTRFAKISPKQTRWLMARNFERKDYLIPHKTFTGNRPSLSMQDTDERANEDHNAAQRGKPSYFTLYFLGLESPVALEDEAKSDEAVQDFC